VDARNDTDREALNRLLLLIASEPRPGWEAEFEELRRKEFERLRVPEVEAKGEDE
jgi:hypothetical protein